MHPFASLLFLIFHNRTQWWLTPSRHHTQQTANPRYQTHRNAQNPTPQRLDAPLRPRPPLKARFPSPKYLIVLSIEGMACFIYSNLCLRLLKHVRVINHIY
ncbi:hypothetical protein F4604DRAFT_1751874 [Suillus subluteus]|nr:hypothetical protein F4604DRAFT_1751874 [Suillus subluteus]